jgi:hypothetical protein
VYIVTIATKKRNPGIIFKLSMKLFEAMKPPRNFGADSLLYASEIHTLKVIGKHSGITATELANRQGIFKSPCPRSSISSSKKIWPTAIRNLTVNSFS